MKTTRDYEALMIVKAAGTEQDAARSAAQAEELVKKIGGRMEHSQSWGRRRLAFRIARQNEGYYHLLRFEAPTDQIVELERLLRLQESIVRFIILTEEELAPLAHSAPRAEGQAGVTSPPALRRYGGERW